ncbi:hypothetical protein GUJ93_ZPchr0003g17301 [Zizania palustris]|uniref:Uncharacterized protein n=1 Tax=Zizania palustris TaxID=103762 RepID=A0A8J5VXP5_ZIZPA|nr:hypothetical protein GUJ93_ZPchr0003g17301 [Zizania palustris]
MNSGGAPQSQLPSKHASSSTVPCDGSGGGGGGGGGGGKSATTCALFASPRLLHSASLPSGSYAKSGSGPEPPEAPCSMSPTSVLDAAAAFAPSPDAGSKRRPWCDVGAVTHGLADALDCTDDDQKRSVLAAASRGVKLQAQQPLVRSCSLDRRVEFGVKNKSLWLPLCGGRGEAAPAEAPGEIEPSSEDYTCVISRGPNPRTVHIFGDRVVEGSGGEELPGASDLESSPRPINLPARGARGFLSL